MQVVQHLLTIRDRNKSLELFDQWRCLSTKFYLKPPKFFRSEPSTKNKNEMRGLDIINTLHLLDRFLFDIYQISINYNQNFMITTYI